MVVDNSNGEKNSSINRRSIFKLFFASSLFFAANPALATIRVPPERLLHLYNPHTDETFSEVYWASGRYIKDAFAKVDYLMRDIHTGKIQQIDPTLLDLLFALRLKLEADRPFNIMSGYRSPETNDLLREEGYEAAPNSLHIQGKAADIHIDGIRLGALHRAATSLQAGGVGYYPGLHFIHVDTGKVRYWTL